MKTCTNCGAEAYRVESMFCAKCGANLPNKDHQPSLNICTNQDCTWHKSKFIYPDDARFCDVCGNPTMYAK